MVRTYEDYLELQYDYEMNKFKPMNVVAIEVFGYKTKPEDVVVFAIQLNEYRRFTTTSTVYRNSDEPPGQAGRDLVYDLFRTYPKECFENKLKDVIKFKAIIRDE